MRSRLRKSFRESAELPRGKVRPLRGAQKANSKALGKTEKTLSKEKKKEKRMLEKESNPKNLKRRRGPMEFL